MSNLTSKDHISDQGGIKPQYASLSDIKRRQLLAHMAYLVFGATTIYAVVDFVQGITVPLYIYLLFYVFAVSLYILNRKSSIVLTRIYGLTFFNVLIFLIASSEPFNTGMHLQFVSAGAVALVLHGYENWRQAMLFIALTFTLHMVTYATDFHVIPWREIHPEAAGIFFIFNSVICAFVCVYAVLMFSRVNYEAEQVLKENERIVREQNQQLKKANAELDRFVYSASHDMRAPLKSILGLIEVFEKSQDLKEIHQVANMMRKSVVKMDEFTNEVIHYSRNARLEIKVEGIYLKELIESIIEDLKFADGHENIRLEVDINDDLVIETDRARLTMVMKNLISNSLKYQDDDKENPFARIVAHHENGKITIRVIDNGIGIPEEHRDKIFDMFYRASESSEGSGLGLYIVRETLTKLNGSVALIPNGRELTEFEVKIPASTNGPGAQ